MKSRLLPGETTAILRPRPLHNNLGTTTGAQRCSNLSAEFRHLGLHRLQRQARKPELISKNCHEQQNTLSLASIILRLLTLAGHGIITYAGFGAQNCWDWLLRSLSLTPHDPSLQTLWFKSKT